MGAFMDPRTELGNAKKVKETGAEDKVESVASGIYAGSYVTKGLEYIQGPSSNLDAIGQFIPALYYFLHGIASIIKFIRGTYVERVTHGLIVALDTISVLALSGAMLTPGIGWAIAAGATFVGWMGDTVIPAWKAYKEFKNYEIQINALENERSKVDVTDVNKITQLDSQIKQWQERREVAHQHYLEKRNDVAWGLVAVVGMALFACGPFGLATVGLIGSAIFLGLALRGVVNLVSNLWQGKKSESAVAVDPSLNEVTNPSLSQRYEKNPKPQPGKTQSTSYVAIKGNLEKNSTEKVSVFSDVAESKQTNKTFLQTDASVTQTGKFAEIKSSPESKERSAKKLVVRVGTQK